MPDRSCVTNCYIAPRKSVAEAPLIHALDDGQGDVRVSLDGYAIVPLEDFESHIEGARAAAAAWTARKNATPC